MQFPNISDSTPFPCEISQPTVNVTKCDAMHELKKQYPPSTHTVSKVQIADGWTIHVEESGNPRGIPVVFVHGGPGAQFYKEDHQWFNPDIYRILVFQQRGTHNCSPSAADSRVDANIFKDITIQILAEDLETLRKHLNIDQWLVFGGSWGSTLSLYYAQQFPASCSGIILRGIYLGTDGENDLFFSQEKVRKQSGAYWNPAVFKRMIEYAASRGLNVDLNDPKTIYAAYRTLVMEQNDSTAARIWTTYENYVDDPSDAQNLARLLSDDPAIETTPEERSTAVWETQMFHLLPMTVNLLDEERLAKLAEMPIKIVHGIRDNICLWNIADKLAKALTSHGSRVDLALIENGAHTPYHPAMTDALVRATDIFAIKKEF